MMRKNILSVLISTMFVSTATQAGVNLIAIGSMSGAYEDLATQTAAPLENGIPGNRFGGIGSGFAYAGGTTFLALPDRGPNANSYNSLVDDTVSYIDRFHRINLSLSPSEPGSTFPFTLTPILRDTTLLSSPSPLVYGTGAGLGAGDCEPALNATNHTHYFTGRSDNFDSRQLSTNPDNARLDPEAVRVSRDGKTVFISDEYGPYIHQFNRMTGKRIKSFSLPDIFAIETLSSQKSVEIDVNTVGRVTNKGMEGLAITPNGKTLVGIMQANLAQDKKKSIRIVTIDISSGATHQYAYLLSDGSGASEIIAVNSQQFLVVERKGNGKADTPLITEEATPAEVKKLYLIDLNDAEDISHVSGDLSRYSVNKTLFLDIVAKLNTAGIDSLDIPSKIEGLAFGEDIVINGENRHTLYITNDNDFLGTIADPHKLPGDPTRGMVENPNVFYVFSFGDEELPGFEQQQIKEFTIEKCDKRSEHH